LHLNLADVYAEAGDKAGAEAIYEKALKKYKKSKKVWSAYELYKLRVREEDGAEAIYKRALQSLSRHKHPEFIIKSALGAYYMNYIDRGRRLFEEFLSVNPKRNDIWHVYLDKEIKMGHINEARSLFDRMTVMKINPKNMKTIFKKYLNFESKYGTKETQENVKQKAKDYVNSLL